MKTKTLRRLFSMLAALVMGLSLLTGCSEKNAERTQEQEDAQTIQVYLWSTSLYENYAPYVQAQLPDVNIEFIVGNNDLDFYKFLQQNGGLPDIITCCRFSLHDAAPLKDSLMNLAMTNEAGAVYNTYLNSFKNEDGSVNWLPVCADAHGFVVNRSLFEQYDIPLPTDYASFVAACQAFEKVGIPSSGCWSSGSANVSDRMNADPHATKDPMGSFSFIEMEKAYEQRFYPSHPFRRRRHGDSR